MGQWSTVNGHRSGSLTCGAWAADVSMTSPRLRWLLTCGSCVMSAWRQHLTCGLRVSVPLTCGTRATVLVDQSTANMGQVLNWPVQGWIWAGLGRADPDTWHAVMLPRHGRGLLLGCGPWLAVYGGPSDAGPWTADWSTKHRVHPSSPRRGPCTPGARAGGRRGGVFPCFSHAVVLLPTASWL